MPKLLEVGDDIIIYGNYGIRGITKVDRVTASQAFFTVTESASFRKVIKVKREPNDWGNLTVIGWDKNNLQRYRVPKDDDVEKAKYLQAILDIQATRWEGVSQEKILSIHKILTTTNDEI